MLVHNLYLFFVFFSSKKFGSSIFGFFQQITGNKVLEESDINPVLEGMKQALMSKNVVCRFFLLLLT